MSFANRDDLISVYDNISALGIELAADMRWENILAAPATPPALPSLKSPFTNRTHAWRAIDFEWAQKTALTREALQAEHRCWLQKIHSNISYWPSAPLTPPPTPPKSTLSNENLTTPLQ